MQELVDRQKDARHAEHGRSRGRASIKAGKFETVVDVDVTPSLFLAIGGLVSMILLSVPPIIRAGKEAARAKADRR